LRGEARVAGREARVLSGLALAMLLTLSAGGAFCGFVVAE
jgi:hypothetical protein